MCCPQPSVLQLSSLGGATVPSPSLQCSGRITDSWKGLRGDLIQLPAQHTKCLYKDAPQGPDSDPVIVYKLFLGNLASASTCAPNGPLVLAQLVCFADSEASQQPLSLSSFSSALTSPPSAVHW